MVEEKKKNLLCLVFHLNKRTEGIFSYVVRFELSVISTVSNICFCKILVIFLFYVNTVSFEIVIKNIALIPLFVIPTSSTQLTN